MNFSMTQKALDFRVSFPVVRSFSTACCAHHYSYTNKEVMNHLLKGKSMARKVTALGFSDNVCATTSAVVSHTVLDGSRSSSQNSGG